MHAAFEVRTTSPPMPAPKKAEKADVRLPMVVTPTFADRLDFFRLIEPGNPNRGAAIRQLVTEALDARGVPPKAKPRDAALKSK